MNVTIRTSFGKFLSLTLENVQTIKGLKEKIYAEYGFPVSNQAIFKILGFNVDKKELENNQKLKDLGMFNSSFLLKFRNGITNFTYLWPSNLDNKVTREMRKTMCLNLKYFSTFRRIFNKNVISAMEIVPRHQFIFEEMFDDEEEMMISAYSFTKPMRASKTSVESSPEVIAAMLSLVDIKKNEKVAVLGIKGGYIQSILCQIINLGGKLVCFTTDKESFNFVKNRSDRISPFTSLQKWVLLDNLQNPNSLKKYAPFDCIYFLGAVEHLDPKFHDLLSPNGRLISPVGAGRLQNLVIREKSKNGKSVDEKIISSWNVIFGMLS